MELGLFIFPTWYTLDPGRLAQLAEERGFERLLFPEHTHIPASRESPYPAGGELPREYSHTYDPFVAVATAAAVTSRIKLGPGICLVIERDPIITAKEVASLDVLSGGRFLFGVGAGWNREEMRNHGTDPGRRFSIMRERVEAMKVLWTEEEASYEGEHVSFERVWSWPKPVQRPYPPVLVGGNGEKVLDRVLAYGDEWLPNRIKSVESLAERIAELRERAGRRVPVSFFNAKPEERALERLREAGVDGALFRLPADPPDEVEKRLDELASLVS